MAVTPAVRFLYSDTAPLMATVATAQAVNIGDPCAYVAGTVVPAASFTWDTNLATTQAGFAAAFLGISGQYKDAATAQITGNAYANQIRLDTHGVYDIPLASSSTFVIGQNFACAKDTGNALLSQSFATTSIASSGIFRAVQDGTSVTVARCRVVNSIIPF